MQEPNEQVARQLRAQINEEDFMKANRDTANSWISAWKQDSIYEPQLRVQKDVWAQNADQQKSSRKERQAMLKKLALVGMPFEEWFQEVQNKSAEERKTLAQPALVQDAKWFERGLRPEEGHEAMQLARMTLQRLRDRVDRGTVDKGEIDTSQQVALATLKVQWNKGAFGSLLNGECGKDFATLANEVQTGACILTESVDGDLERIVALLTLRLERGGNVLAEVGYVLNKKIIARCRLPGSKHIDFERADETLHRELNTTFAPLRDGIFLEGVKHTETRAVSMAYGMPSIYQMSEQHAKVDTDYPLPRLPLAYVKGKVPPQFSKTFVCALLCQGKVHLYAWLQPSILERLSSPEGKPELQSWLSALEIDEDAAFSELCWTMPSPKSKVRVGPRPTVLRLMSNAGNGLFKDIKGKFRNVKHAEQHQDERIDADQNGESKHHSKGTADTKGHMANRRQSSGRRSSRKPGA